MPEPTFEHENKNLSKPQPEKPPDREKQTSANPIADLQQQVGNRAVQRLIQRKGSGPNEVDEETAGRIDAARGGGKELDAGTQESMGSAMGYDFSGVRVHTSSESDELNESLRAEAFTTGSDVFFSDGAYDPDTSQGQELLAHELTHVVQQGSGEVGGTGNMKVNDPGDVHEQQADQTAESVVSAPVQKQEEEEYAQTKPVQRQEEEEYAQTKLAQRQEEEEEELVMTQPLEEEEEMIQPQAAEDLEEEAQL